MVCREVPCRASSQHPSAHLKTLLRDKNQASERLEGRAGEADPGFEGTRQLSGLVRVPPGTHFYSLWLNTILNLGFRVLSSYFSPPYTARASGQKSKSDRKPHRAKSLSSSFLELDFLSHDWMPL